MWNQYHDIIDDCLELLSDLDENSTIAVTTLNDLMHYDKIESKSFSIEEKDVNIWSVLEKTVSPLTLQAKEKSIDLQIITPFTHPSLFPEADRNINHLRVVGDSIKLGQVIRNLVSNALKFTPRNGEVKITGR